MKRDKLYAVNKWNKPVLRGHKYTLAGKLKKMFGKDTVGGAVVGAAAPAVGGLMYNGISGGLNSTAGSAISSLGSTIGGAVSQVNPLLGGAITVGSNVLGGITSNLFGSKLNQDNINTVENNISGLHSAGNELAGATTNQDVLNSWSGVNTGFNFSNSYIGKDGVFSNKAKNKANRLRAQQDAARSYAVQGLATGVKNADNNMDTAVMKGFVAAYGGPLELMANNDSNMGPIEYGLLSDYINTKKNKTASDGSTISYMAPVTYSKGGNLSRAKDYGSKEKPYPNVKSKDFAGGGRSYPIPTKADAIDALRLAGLHGRNDAKARVYKKYPELKKHAEGDLLNFYTPYDTFFAEGGSLHNHGVDWNTGLTEINEGGSHSENPYGGVPYGIAPDGEPNLVEEKEVIYNDNVYSERIKADKQTIKDYGYPKKYEGKSFAYIARDREEKVKERPNDPIAGSAFKEEMEVLFDAQETQKQRHETERLLEAFESLSPEEQALVLRQAQNTEQQAEMAQQEQSQQETPEQQAYQQQAVQQASEGQVSEQQVPGEQIPEQAVTAAAGGSLGHRFDGGGTKKVGTWKNKDENHWDIYTRPGLMQFIYNLKDAINKAGTDEEKADLRNRAIETFNNIQERYLKYVSPYLGAAGTGYNKDVEDFQELFNEAGGNYGFNITNGDTTTDISGSVDLPTGANTGDNKEGNYQDGYVGPYTSIRNWGSTEYGNNDFYNEVVKAFNDLGITYAPNSEWQYKYNNNPYQLYKLSLAENENNGTNTNQDNVTGKYAFPWTPSAPENSTNTNQTAVKESKETDEIKPPAKIPYRSNVNTLIGNMAPYAGLGLYFAGVGKPDTSELTASQNYLNNTAVAHPSYVSNYLRYRPFDVWANQEVADARSLATDRVLTNTASPSRAANLLANSYISQLGNGSLYQKAREYNDNLRQKTVQQASVTDQFNVSAENQVALANAQTRNQANSARASLAANIAGQKQAAKSAWDNALYQNLGNLFQQYAAQGKEDRDFNKFAALLNAGYGNGVVSRALVDQLDAITNAKGGKIRKRRRGLTI